MEDVKTKPFLSTYTLLLCILIKIFIQVQTNFW